MEAKEDAVYKIDFDEAGNIVQKKTVNVQRGAKSKAQGLLFEKRVREDLESKAWIVDKWTNNIDLEADKIVAAKKKMRFINGKMRFMSLGTGFPDFVCFHIMDEHKHFKVVGVEVKMNGKLSKLEKEKCSWYLQHDIFNEIWIARKEKEQNRIKVVYEEFKG